MSATVHQVKQLADVVKFLKETDAESTRGECHNALTWLAIQIKKAGLETHNVHLCTGTFAGFDHSWLMIEDTDMYKLTIIDMTVDQFAPFNVPYVGPLAPGYVLRDSLLLSEPEPHIMMEFLERLGL